MRCSHRAAHLERLAAWRDRGSLPDVPQPVCCAARRVLHWPHSFVSGAVRAGTGGTRVVHDGGVNSIVPRCGPVEYRSSSRCRVVLERLDLVLKVVFMIIVGRL